MTRVTGNCKILSALNAVMYSLFIMYKYTPIFYTSFIQKYIFLKYLVDLINVWNIFG